MRRREFLSVLGGAASAWPVGTWAQQGEQLIGFLSGSPASTVEPSVTVLKARLTQLGWRDPALSFDVRYTAGNFAALDAEAEALVGRGSRVIVAVGTPALKAVQRHSRSVPIVFLMVSDPVGQRLIENLARPGGQSTGLTNFEFSMSGKWLELLKEIAPGVRSTTLIANPANTGNASYIPSITTAAHTHGVEMTTLPVRNAQEIEQAIGHAANKPSGSFMVLPDSLPNVHRDLIIGLATRHRLPAIYAYRDFPEHGGLMSYGLDYLDAYRQAAGYVDKILRGTKPADLPVQAPNKFELVLNLKTARTLGLIVPQSLQVAADEVIE